MNFWLCVLVILLVVPLIMILSGRRFIKKGAPENIETIFGYRTRRSTMSWDTWTFAHKQLGKIWFNAGLILLPVSAGLHAISIKSEIDKVCIFGLLIIALQVVAMVVSFAFVEKKLKANFDFRGERTEESLAAEAKLQSEKEQKKQKKATAKAGK